MNSRSIHSTLVARVSNAPLPSSHAVSEPGSAALVLAGLLATAATRRRRA